MLGEFGFENGLGLPFTNNSVEVSLVASGTCFRNIQVDMRYLACILYLIYKQDMSKRVTKPFGVNLTEILKIF